MKCVMQGTCKARIILDEDQQLSSSIPVPSHTSQEAAIEVCKAKNSIKRLASTTDNTTKNIIASSLSTLDYVGVTKLNCQIPSLSKMSHRARQHSNPIPPIPDSLEHMPLVYGLLPGKTERLYTSFFEELDSYGDFVPQSILCDYEKGLHNALHKVWAGSTIRGCYFHYKH